MNLKAPIEWSYKKLCDYNLFKLEENDYNDEDDNKDPAIVLQHQKYKTWLYAVLLTGNIFSIKNRFLSIHLLYLIVCLYMLFYITLIKMESKTVVISDITPDIFTKLTSEYSQSLSCPCTTSTILYKNFVSNNIIMHPVCSSDFVDKQWIEGLYLANRTYYNAWDFRTIGFSQVSHCFFLLFS